MGEKNHERQEHNSAGNFWQICSTSEEIRFLLILNSFLCMVFLLVSGLKDQTLGFVFTQKGHRTREIWTGEDWVAAAAEKLGSCRRRWTPSKIHPGRIRPRKILKFGPDVPEIHKMFQNKFGPKRNSDEGGINSRRRIKTAGIQKRKEFQELNSKIISN